MQLWEQQHSDCERLAELSYQTVHIVNSKDYTKEQLDVWATGKVDLCEWNSTFLKHKTIVAVENGNNCQLWGYDKIKSAFVGLKDFLLNTGANVAAALIQAKM